MFRPPYYALDAVELRQPGFVKAHVQPEHPLGHELGPLAAAEAGRHLAIIGACACSSIREPVGLHYYLAHRARIKRGDAHVESDVRLFEAEASSETRTGREAVARATLRAADSSEPMYEIEVSYKVLSQRAFQRVFAAHRKDLRAEPRESLSASQEQLRSLRRNPYRTPLPLEITRRTPQSVQAVLPTVSADLCAGHFPLYPALPVAVLMHSLVHLCGEALRERWGDTTRYRVMHADVCAERLAFAGERLLFEAAFQRSEPGRDHYQASAALEDGTPIGSMTIALEPVPAGSASSLTTARN